jgi:hypothetical protein
VSARVYYGPPRDLAAWPVLDFDEVVGHFSGRVVAETRAGRAVLGYAWPVVGELWQRLAELSESPRA